MTTSMRHTMIRRDDYNKRIIDYINKIIEKEPELRFNQIMFILNETNDYFNEEPWFTYKRLQEKFKI